MPYKASMSHGDDDARDLPEPGRMASFATTHWSVVLLAGDDAAPASAEALERLCRTYWYPLYAYLRRDGHGAEEAQDLTQEFFARLLKGNFLKEVGAAKGRFRSFLLAALKHFLANEWDRERARKRGSDYAFISWDADEIESRYAQEATRGLTAERVFERRWALSLLDRVLDRLREDYAATGRRGLFEELQAFLSERTEAAAYHEVAARLGVKESALRVAVHRFRRRYGELLRREIAHTVRTPAEIDDEIRYLFTVISN